MKNNIVNANFRNGSHPHTRVVCKKPVAPHFHQGILLTKQWSHGFVPSCRHALLGIGLSACKPATHESWQPGHTEATTESHQAPENSSGGPNLIAFVFGAFVLVNVVARLQELRLLPHKQTYSWLNRINNCIKLGQMPTTDEVSQLITLAKSDNLKNINHRRVHEILYRLISHGYALDQIETFYRQLQDYPIYEEDQSIADRAYAQICHARRNSSLPK